MKTQKTLLIAGLAMSVAMATGCKNSSLNAEDRVKNSPVPVFVGADAAAPEATKLEIATQLKEKVKAASAQLKESRDNLEKAKENRDNMKVARDAEGNTVIKEILSVQLEASIVEVQTLEKNVMMAADLVKAERKILNNALEGMTADDKAKIGEADIEYQVEYQAELDKQEAKARVEMSLDAERELVKNTEERIQRLNERLAQAKEYIEHLDSSDQNSIQVEEAQKNFGVLMNELEEANKILAIAIASEDNLVKALEKLSL